MFKKEFKYYKSRCPPPTYDNVIDFHFDPGNLSNQVTRRNPYNDIGLICCKNYGLHEVKYWKMYEFKEKSGLIFIVNPFTKTGQQYWIRKCLQEYTKKPSRLNIDPFHKLKPCEDWWEAAQIDNEEGKTILMTLRWATLGYHHNWDTKEYSESARDEFPTDLAELSRVVVQAVVGASGASFCAQAAIVNFYHLDSNLSGHKDISEPDMNSPLISISFGQSAVFLVGGDTLCDPVTAIFLHSGDIVLMSGPARQCYHGIPRIVSTKDKPWAGDGWENTGYGKYLETSRININVRQVLPPGENVIKR